MRSSCIEVYFIFVMNDSFIEHGMNSSLSWLYNVIFVHIDVVYNKCDLGAGWWNFMKAFAHYGTHTPGNHRSVHYIDVIMTTMASQITSLTVVYSIVYWGADQWKHQSSASLAFVREIHRNRWIPAQRASNAENVSIWWRHHIDNNT